MMRPAILALSLIVLSIALYAFALLPRFGYTLGVTLKTAAKLAVGFFPRTAGMLVFTVALWLLSFRFWRLMLPLLLLFGLALPCYFAAILYNDIFRRMEE